MKGRGVTRGKSGGGAEDKKKSSGCCVLNVKDKSYVGSIGGREKGKSSEEIIHQPLSDAKGRGNEFRRPRRSVVLLTKKKKRRTSLFRAFKRGTIVEVSGHLKRSHLSRDEEDGSYLEPASSLGGYFHVEI